MALGLGSAWGGHWRDRGRVNAGGASHPMTPSPRREPQGFSSTPCPPRYAQADPPARKVHSRTASLPSINSDGVALTQECGFPGDDSPLLRHY